MGNRVGIRKQNLWPEVHQVKSGRVESTPKQRHSMSMYLNQADRWCAKPLGVHRAML